MTFSKDITQLKIGVSDNFTRNNQAHTDLDTKLTSIESDLNANLPEIFIDDIYYKYFGQELEFSRLYDTGNQNTQSNIGYWKENIMSFRYGAVDGLYDTETLPTQYMYSGDSHEQFLSSFYYLNSPTVIEWNNSGTYPGNSNNYFKRYPFHILNTNRVVLGKINTDIDANYVVSNVVSGSPAASEQHYTTRRYDQGEREFDGNFSQVVGASIYDSTSITSKESQNVASSELSICIRFSINRVIEARYRNTTTTLTQFHGPMVGLFLLNQPIFSLNEGEVNLSNVYDQTDGICTFLHLNMRNQNVPGNILSDDNYPEQEPYLHPYEAKVYCGRVYRPQGTPGDWASDLGRGNVLGLAGEPYTYFTSNYPYFGSHIRWDLNAGKNTIAGCDNNFNNDGFLLDQFYAHYDKSPIINELKIEFAQVGTGQATEFVAIVYFNNRPVDKFVMSRTINPISPDYDSARGWFNLNHLIPGLILNAPFGMITVHSFEIDMD